MLDVDSVVPFLVERGLLRQDVILAGHITVDAVPRRNRNLSVLTSEASGLFLKQAEPNTAGCEETLRCEAAFYERHSWPGSPLAESLTRFLFYEPELALLAVELLATHQGLWDYYRSFPHPRFPIHTFRELGRRLATIHATLTRDAVFGQPEDAAPRSGMPQIFSVHEPGPDALATMSPVDLEILAIVQSSPAIVAGFHRAAAQWEPNAVIHGDMRAENVLVHTCAGQPDDVRIVDWELVRAGDSAWDLAALLQDLVLYWLGGLPVVPDQDIEDMVANSTGLPWPVLQAAGRALWQAYCSAAGCVTSPVGVTAAKLADFSAVRMVQTVLEMVEGRDELPPVAVLLLQVCENVFAAPERASAEVFGLV